MNADVHKYLTLFDDNSWPVNEAVLDRATRDYAPHLSGAALHRAQMEVVLMGWVETWAFMNFGRRAVAEFLTLHERIDGVDPEAMASSMAAMQDAAAATTTAAENASADAAAASQSATNANQRAQAAEQAAQAAATGSADAAQAAAAAEQAAESAAGALAVLEAAMRVALKATNLDVVVSAGVGTPTLVPWPSSAICPAPYTRRPGSVAIQNGRLHISEAGLYLYTLSGTFTTGLLAAGAFRFAVSTSSAPADAIQHAVQVPLLGANPAGLSGSGLLSIPPGGADVAIHAGHTVALLGTALSFAELRMSLHRIDIHP